MSNTEISCPFCHSLKVRRYRYGRFAQTESEEEFQEKYLIGGCLLTEDSPVYHCDACNKDFGKLGGEGEPANK